MIDYEFYVNSYMGSAIPEKAFAPLAARAAGELGRFERIYRVVGTDGERQMALCAMAEALYADSKRPRGVAAETVGSNTVRYDTAGSLTRELYRKALIYLRIYRGSGHVE